MRKKNYNRIAVGFALLVVLVIALLLSNSLRRTSHIVLPNTDSSSGASSGGDVENSLERIEVTPETVRAAVATLKRPESYLRTVTVKYYWSGGSGSFDTTVAVSGDYTRADSVLTGGRVRHMLTDGKTTWIWYDSDRTAYSGPAGEITADEEEHIPTYEDVLDLKTEEIAAADYRVYSGQNCIYVETEPDPDGYVLRYWISVEGLDSMGLLVGAEQLKDGQTVYRMTAQTVEGTGPTTKNFTLPDGTVLREVGS